MDATLCLRLAAPLQSWGTRSRFTNRDTEREPTKSGVIGLLCSALGRPRSADLSDLSALRFGVRIDAPGRVERDFHTAQQVPNTAGKKADTVISERFYLADAVFVAGLEGDRELLEVLDAALWAPHWPLALGRKACVPTPPLSLGVRSGDLISALRSVPWQVQSRRLRTAAAAQAADGQPRDLLAVVDAGEETSDDTRNDVPVSFEDRRFTSRTIRRITVPLTAELIGQPPAHAAERDERAPTP